MASITCPYCHTTFPLAPPTPPTPEQPAPTPKTPDYSEATVMDPVAAAANPVVETPPTEMPPVPDATVAAAADATVAATDGAPFTPAPDAPYMQAPYPPQQPAQPYNPAVPPQYGQPYGMQQPYGQQPYQPVPPQMAGAQPTQKPRKSSLTWLWSLLTFLVMAASFLFVMSKTDTGLGRTIRQALGMKDPFRVQSSYQTPSSSTSDTSGELPLEDLLGDDDDEDVAEEVDYVDYNGHTAVDMGLSVDWADMNVGADEDYNYGALFVWSSYIASNEWGGDWRMPTPDEFQELIDNCSTYSDWNGGNYGMYFTSRITHNTIFLPYTGFCNPNRDERINYDKTGHYWSAVLDYDDSKARNMSIGDATGAYLGQHDRYSRQAVRPVIRKTNY